MNKKFVYQVGNNKKSYQWEVCGDFKVIAVLLGLQAGYTKYSCFLYEWNSRARGTHCSRKHWPPQTIINSWTEKCYTQAFDKAKQSFASSTTY